jgi:hypothetical protein
MSIEIKRLANQPTINILWTPSKKGRQDALLAGVPGLATMLLTCAAADLPEGAIAKIQFDGDKAILPIPMSARIGRRGEEILIETYLDHCYVAVEPGYHVDPKALIAEGESLWAAAVTERRDTEARREVERLETATKREEARHVKAAAWIETLDGPFRDLPQVAHLRVSIAKRRDVGEEYGGPSDWVEARRAVNEADARRVQAERAAALDAETAERRIWIEAHGSERLRLLLAGGYAHEAVYRDERLALDLPGWAANKNGIEGEYDKVGSPMEPRNPPLGALRAHKEAGEAGESIELLYLPTYRHDPNADDADDEGDVRCGGIYVLARKHLGRTVYRLATVESSQEPETT